MDLYPDPSLSELTPLCLQHPVYTAVVRIVVVFTVTLEPVHLAQPGCHIVRYAS